MTAAIDFRELSLCDALDLAILIEEEAKDRYEELADQMHVHRNEEAGRFFLRMVQVELTHERVLLSRRRLRFPKEPCRVTRAMIFDVEAPDYDAARATMSVRSGLEMALAAETKARAFFDAALKNVEDPEVQLFFTQLRDEEIEHQNLVLAMIAKLEPEGVMTPEDVSDEPVAN